MTGTPVYYFIGIKGTGMSSLACMLKDLGYEVCGSDLAKHFFTEDVLVERNIPREYTARHCRLVMNVLETMAMRLA